MARPRKYRKGDVVLLHAPPVLNPDTEVLGVVTSYVPSKLWPLGVDVGNRLIDQGVPLHQKEVLEIIDHIDGYEPTHSPSPAALV